MSVYQSILPRITEASDPDYWKDVSGLTINYVPVSELPSAMRSWWGRSLSLSPRQMHESLLHGYADRVSVNVDVSPHRSFRFSLMWDDNTSYYADATYDMSLIPRITTSAISIPSALRGQGTGKLFIRNFMELHNSLGANRFLFSAGDENGAYTWGSMGGHLDMRPIYRGPIRHLSTTLRGRFDVVRSDLPREIHEGVRSYLDLRRPDDIVNLIRDYRHISMPSSLKPDLEDVSKHMLSKRLIKFLKINEPDNKMPHLVAYEEVRHIGRAFELAAKQGLDGLSLPRYLLARTEWGGVVDFANMKQMEQVGNYLGGWKTIRPLNARPEVELSTAPALTNG